MTTQEQALPSTKHTSLFTTGFALFSMFFGAGNLIFPLLIGKSVGENGWYAIAGLGITAVIVPFLGLAGMIFFDADLRKFFGRIGAIPGALLLLLLQLILGPFGVIPRLVTLMHAIVQPYLFNLSLPIFSILAATLIFACSFRKQNLIGLLGTVLTPILLLSLACLFFCGFIYGPHAAPSHTPAWDSFFQGLLGGYNTMDLIAAFLFATVVLPHFKKEASSTKDSKKFLTKQMFFSSIIAASLLLITYIGLCFISSYHSGSIADSCSQEGLLGAIAVKLLGPTGGFIAAIAIVTACLTTAITLTLIFADYLQKDLLREKIPQKASLIITLLVTTLFANLGFSGISAFLGPILQICYPGLIVLTILNIFYYFTGFKAVKWPVFMTFAASALLYFI
jgi:LIVCS family branched-chain amino acid:cation transporter